MRTDITITVQTFDKRGDGLGLPTTLVRDDHRFDNDTQAQRYYEDLNDWIETRPAPDPELHPFPRKQRRTRQPHEIIEILDRYV
jgi:hypothetical protein